MNTIAIADLTNELGSIGWYIVFLMVMMFVFATSSLLRIKRSPKKLSDRDDRYLGPGGTIFLFMYLFAVFGISVYILVTLLSKEQPSPDVSPEARYLLLAASGGASGSSLTALSTLMSTVGNRLILKTWLLFYFFRVLVSVPVTVVLYGIIRAVLLAPYAPITDLNPYGIFGISGFTGVFTSSIINRIGWLGRPLGEQQSELRAQIDQIGSVLGAGILDNYHGFICLSIMDEEGGLINLDSEGNAVLNTKRHYSLNAQFQPSDPNLRFCREVVITNGTDSRNVEFHLVMDSDLISIQPRQHVVPFEATTKSPIVAFRFASPTEAGSYEIGLEISQKNRLIQFLSVTLAFDVKENESK
jgi:hypothetical protein